MKSYLYCIMLFFSTEQMELLIFNGITASSNIVVSTYILQSQLLIQSFLLLLNCSLLTMEWEVFKQVFCKSTVFLHKVRKRECPPLSCATLVASFASTYESSEVRNWPKYHQLKNKILKITLFNYFCIYHF